MASKITDHLKSLMRHDYEVQGHSYPTIAENYNVSVNTVAKYKKEGDWQKPAPTDPGSAATEAIMSDDPDIPGTVATPAEWDAVTVVDVDAVAPIDVPAAPEPESDVEKIRLRAEIDRLNALNAELRSKVDSLRDTVDVGIYADEDEVVEVLGEKALRETALMRLRMENRKQMQRYGVPGINFADPANKHMVDDEIHVIVGELLRERTSHISPLHNLRTLKMRNPKTGHLVQIAMEEQINNMKGEQTAPIAKMRAKGFQLCEPFLCQLMDCWLPASRDPHNQKLNLNGYCSPEHRARDPYLDARKVADVTTTANVGMRDW
jgi:hypothetical protein